MTGERRPWSDPKSTPLADASPRFSTPPTYRPPTTAKVTTPPPKAEKDPLQEAVRAIGRRLQRAGAAEVQVGKCDEHGFHAATSAQKGRAHVTIEGTGRSPLAAVEDLDRLVRIHLGKRKGGR